MMKRLICLCVALMLTMGAALAEVNIWPASEEKLPVTIAVVGQQSGEYDTENMWITNYWEEVSNLDITWMSIDSSIAGEKITLMMASGEMPDAILGYYGFGISMLTQYGVEEGVLYDFNKLLDNMPGFSAMLEEKPHVRAALTATDGAIYGLPNMTDGDYSFFLRYFVNNEWLEKAGKAMPTTLDEMYDVLCAFRDGDMNGNGDATDEIPFSGSWNDGYSERAWFLNAFGFCTRGSNTALYYDENGEASPAYIPNTELYKEYLTYMNKLWNENLLDRDLFTQTDAQVTTKLVEGKVGYANCASPAAVDPSLEFIYDTAHTLKAGEANAFIYPEANAVIDYGMFVINADCDEKTAAALAKFADSFFHPETFVLYQIGPSYSEEAHAADPELGHMWNTEFGSYMNPETGAIAYKFDETEYSSSWIWRSTNMSFWSLPGYSCNGNPYWQVEFAKAYPETAMGQRFARSNFEVEYNHWTQQSIDTHVEHYHKMMPSFFYNAEDQLAVTDYTMVLDDYVSNMEAKFITGELSIEENWEEFQSTLEQYGVKEYMEILNSYWAIYNA